MTCDLPLGLAIGDPNGIGPEIAVKAARAVGEEGIRTGLVCASHVVEHYQRRVGLTELEISEVTALDTSAFSPGNVAAAGGRATIAYVEAAVDLVRRGAIRAIVAAPHSERAIHEAGIPFSGYPSLIERITGATGRVFLMLVGGGLRITHVTLHERLADALERLTPELVADAVRATADALVMLGIERPRIGIFGINPHAGEDGLFGDDDARITEPAARRLREERRYLDGPMGADLLLTKRQCHAYVAMYHDQGHVPVKLVAGRDIAALSIGGGIVFSSVGHGSAFDIAGKDLADPSALITAARLLAGMGTAPEPLGASR